MSEQNHKVALVTGASRGIGEAIAIGLGEAGYKVAIHYNSSADRAQAICEKIPGSKIFKADISDPDACSQLTKDVKSELGPIDVLVNNAGICIDQVLAFAKPDDFSKLLDTNVKPVFLLSKLASKQMMRKKKGRIINISSVVGFTGNGGQSMYAATKAAIVGFTKSIATDIAGYGITANCIAPGFIETDMTKELPPEAKEAILSKIPANRLGTTKEIADTVVFLASDSAAYITGSTIHVNGGMYTN